MVTRRAASSMARRKTIADGVGTFAVLLRVQLDRLVAHNFARLVERGFGDVRPAHSAVLRSLPAEGTRIKDLASQAGVTKQSMAELVEYLQERGYVKVSVDRTDARARI